MIKFELACLFFPLPLVLQSAMLKRVQAQADTLRSAASETPAIALVLGAALGWLASAVHRRLNPEIESNWSDDDDDEDGQMIMDTGGECKLVLCVRTDLGMSRGKIAAQAGHATLGAYQKAKRMAPGMVRRWEQAAQPKIALAIRSAAQARELERAAKSASLPTYVVCDAGRTQVAAVS